MPRFPSTALLIITMLICSGLNAQSLLPADEQFTESVPAPASVLGWEVGEWHARPEQVAEYFRILADASDRISLKTIGRTHEQRPLIHAIVTHPDNHARLDNLRQAHLDGAGPLVVWLGYSIHGNEASGSNAALVMAYHLAAGEADWADELLRETVVIIDPMFNPDGLGRFATWANMHRGEQTVANQLHRAHWEAWPSGRFNHYWFDMNRDWLPATQPESVARLKQFHRWLPHVLGDFHEQGANRGYFFQPGVPDRNNPLTPNENFEITAELARYHAQALDKVGQPYYTRESFDDFYYGKGSTYPDINGSIGILYEQPSARGHRTESIHGEFTFADAVRNQYLTSVSTLRGAHAQRDRLIDYQNRFFETTRERAAQRPVRAWVFGDNASAGRSARLVELLRLHTIEVQPLARSVEIDGQTFEPGNAWVVPARQRQAGLVQAMFEQRGEFESNVFYDVSAWTLPLAFNLPFAKLDYLPETRGQTSASSSTADVFQPDPSAVAYRMPAKGHNAHRTALALLDAELPVSRAGNTRLPVADNSSYRTGHYLIPLRNDEQRKAVDKLLVEMGADYPTPIHSVASGFNPAGADLGSPSVVPLKAPRPVMLVGQGVVPMEAGHTWHLLDRRLGLPTPMLDMNHPEPLNLNGYTHLLIPNANLAGMKPDWLPVIRSWVKAGGVLVTQKNSARWAEALFVAETQSQPDEPPEEGADPVADAIKTLFQQPDQSAETLGRQPYDSFQDDAADRIVGGAIFNAEIDTSHPLLTGYDENTLPVFVNSVTRLKPSINAYSTPMVFASSEPVAGFASGIAEEKLKGAPLLVADRVGQGLVIKFAFNPNFRAFWYGTEGLYINALLNSGLVSSTVLPPVPD